MYSSNGGDSVSYVQATSPQPSGFPAIAVSRAPLNYSPVSIFKFCPKNTEGEH
jgi:RNA-binding protein Musashi